MSASEWTSSATTECQTSELLSEPASAWERRNGEESVISDTGWGEMLEVARHEGLRLTHDEFHADDLAGIVIKKIFSRNEQISKEGRAAYVRACVHNAYFDELRYERAAMRGGPMAELTEEDLLGQLNFFGGTRSSAKSPSQKIIHRERKQEMQRLVERILDGLSERHRELLMLSVSEMSNAEIAVMMRYEDSDSVKTTLSRLRKGIRERFGLDIESVLQEW